MTIIELSTIIRELLQCNDYVTLPSMGTFVVEHVPSQIVNEGKSITPPSCEVHFDSSRTEGNESLHRLAACHSEGGAISKDAAEESILSLIKEIKMELLEKTFIEFPQFGTIKFSSDSQFIFEPHPAFDPSAQFYGLEVLPIKRLAELENGLEHEPAGNVEAGSGFSQDSVVESESVEKSPSEDAPAEEESAHEMVVDNAPAEKIPADDVPAEGATDEEVPADDHPAEEAQADVIPEAVAAGTTIAETIVTEDTAAEEKSSEGFKAEVAQQKAKGGSGFPLPLWAKLLLALVLLLVLAVLAVILFKEELMPLLEKLLYSEEELRFIKEHGL